MNTQPDIEQPEEQEVPAAAETPVNEVEALKAEIANQKDAVLRARAEMDNYRKRMAREKEDAIRYSNMALLESLIPIVDNFELGLEAAKNATDASGIVLGLSMVRKQLEDFLRSHGVETLDATGQTFDPNLHEAVGHEEHAEVEEGKVISQLRRGFKLKDRLIRPATVVVSKGTPVE